MLSWNRSGDGALGADQFKKITRAAGGWGHLCWHPVSLPSDGVLSILWLQLSNAQLESQLHSASGGSNFRPSTPSLHSYRYRPAGRVEDRWTRGGDGAPIPPG